MASEKISQLPDASALDGTEIVPIVQGGQNVKITVSALLSFLLRNLAGGELVWFDGANLATDSSLSFSPLSGISTGQFSCSSLAVGSSAMTVDSSGNVVCPSVDVGNGTSFDGDVAMITVVQGIVTAAA